MAWKRSANWGLAKQITSQRQNVLDVDTSRCLPWQDWRVDWRCHDPPISSRSWRLEERLWTLPCLKSKSQTREPSNQFPEHVYNILQHSTDTYGQKTGSFLSHFHRSYKTASKSLWCHAYAALSCSPWKQDPHGQFMEIIPPVVPRTWRRRNAFWRISGVLPNTTSQQSRLPPQRERKWEHRYWPSGLICSKVSVACSHSMIALTLLPSACSNDTCRSLHAAFETCLRTLTAWEWDSWISITTALVFFQNFEFSRVTTCDHFCRMLHSFHGGHNGSVSKLLPRPKRMAEH